jgi:NhaA family Na+:H+ antiporter
MLGVAFLGGIGFTMSLFIGMLAFVDTERAAEIRIGVLLGSIMSACVGYMILRQVTPAVVSAKPTAKGHQ